MRRALPAAATLVVLACSPPTAFDTVEGLRCTIINDEACSDEPGFPRARCTFERTWQIVEKCADQGCFVAPTSGGRHITACGHAPTGVASSSPDATAAKADTAAGADTAKDTGAAKVDTKEAADTGAPTGPPTQCDGYTCGHGQACIAGDGCDHVGCACKAGERCVPLSEGKDAKLTCATYCFGTCWTDDFCSPAGPDTAGLCKAAGCAAPADLGAAWVAVSLAIDPTAAAPGPACDHLPGAKAAFNSWAQATLSAGWAGAAAADGGNTVVLASLLSGNAAMVARTKGGAPCPATGLCAVELSKRDNLEVPSSTGGTCQARFPAGALGRFARMAVPIVHGGQRGSLVLHDVAVAMPADQTSAVACGYVNSAGLAAFTAAVVPAAAGSAASWPADVDSTGKGKADAWSVRVELSLRPATLAKWLP